MPFFDLPIDQLREYRPAVAEPSDFEEFWTTTLNESQAELLSMSPVGEALRGISAWDVTFAGYGGQEIRAWYLRPADTTQDLPLVVEYVGYGGGRGLPEEHTTWPSLGYALLVVDSRGQGNSWGSGGDSGDIGETGSTTIGFMTRGIEDPQHYYYRRFFTDAANAVDVAHMLPGVDSERVILTGGSQGGGLTLAAAALAGMRGSQIAGAMPNVPFLCNFERAVGLTGGHPYQEVVQYLSVKRDMEQTVFQTLSYFDCVNMAKRISVPTLFSAGLMDEITPPSTVFAAHNWVSGPSQIEVYRFNGHEGGGTYQLRKQVEWLGELLG